jgi:hypothetical protein
VRDEMPDTYTRKILPYLVEWKQNFPCEVKRKKRGPIKGFLFCGAPNLHYNFFSTIDNYFIRVHDAKNEASLKRSCIW